MESATALNSCEQRIDFGLIAIEEQCLETSSLTDISLNNETNIGCFNFDDEFSSRIEVDVEVTDHVPQRVHDHYPITLYVEGKPENQHYSLTKVFNGLRKSKSDNDDTSCLGIAIPLDSSKSGLDKREKLKPLPHNKEGQFKHRCANCGRGFKEKSHLASHSRAHFEERKYQCSECEKAFKTKSNLKFHLDTHSSEPFQCKTCSKVYTSRKKLHRHMKISHCCNHHQCTECGKILKSAKSLKSHCLLHGSNSRPYSCDMCSRSFIYKSALVGHVRSAHSCIPCSKQNNSVRCPEHTLSCDQCNRQYSSRSALAAHIKKHSSAQPFLCRKCDKSFVKRSSYEIHVKARHNHERPQFMCDQCSLSYYTKFALQRHYVKHTSDRSFLCQVCSKTFWTKDALRVHGQSHSGVKMFSCPICNKRFVHKHSVVVHLKTHNPVEGK